MLAVGGFLDSSEEVGKSTNISMSEAVGFTLAIAAAIMDGCYAVPARVEALLKLEVRPVVFFFYNSVAVFIFGWICAMFIPFNSTLLSGGSNEFQFVWLAFLAGASLALCVYTSFIAVDIIGIALGSAVHSGTSIFVSAMFSVLFMDHDPNNLAVYLTGVMLLTLGVASVALNQNIADFCDYVFKRVSVSETTRLVNGDEAHPSQDWSLANARSYGVGIFIAVICGFIGGLSLVPYDYVDISQQGLVFMPAFSTGVMAVAVVTIAVFFVLPSEKHRISLKDFHLGEPIVAGMAALSGMFLGFQFVFSFFAYSILPYGVVTPIVLTSILVSSLLGIVMFDEIQGEAALTVFYLSSVIVLLGAVLISL